MCGVMRVGFYFLFNDTATTEIYTYYHTLSLHDALPISCFTGCGVGRRGVCLCCLRSRDASLRGGNDRLCRRGRRSEEHTSELQSLMRISYAVFCLKKKKRNTHNYESLMSDYTSSQSGKHLPCLISLISSPHPPTH